jgi:phage shock protein C
MADHDDLIGPDAGPSRPSLYRPRDDRMIAGVCAGIARYFGWSPTSVRVVYVLGSILSAAFPGTVVYIALWLLMPGDPKGPRSFRLH